MRIFQEPLENDPYPKYPCGICLKNVGRHRKAVKCDSCRYWNHIKCEGIDNKMYEALKKEPENSIHFCKICMEENLPFQKISDNEFLTSIVKNIEFNEDLNLAVKPPTWLKTLFTDFSDKNDDEAMPINCKYYDASSTIPFSNRANFSMFHLNLASLSRHKDELEAALSLLNFTFDIIAITETRIIKGNEPNYDISMNGYKHYFTPTESTKGGIIVYIKDHFNVKRRCDQKIYKERELESVILEIINEKSKNELFGCIYRHPSMSID